MDLKIVCLTKEKLCLFLNGGGGGIRNLQSRKYVKTLIGKSSSHSKVQGRDSKDNEQQQSQQGAGYRHYTAGVMGNGKQQSQQGAGNRQQK